MSRARRALPLFAVLLFVLTLATWTRTIPGLAHPYAHPSTDDGRWFSRDVDGLYHARRVDRALDSGLAVASRDERMNFPDGAAIPWPPYYDQFLAVVLAPFVPEDAAARREFLEHAVARAPFVCGLATLCLLVLWTTRVAGWIGALVAGTLWATSFGSINYSVLGCGDHHAWVTLLATAILVAASRAFEADQIAIPRRALAWGVLCGALAGVMIGSWVAALLTVMCLQAVLGWWFVERARGGLEGLAHFGLAFHLTAALVLLPAILDSPWRAEFPWMVVNLSWFHLAELALGALVFVPPLLAGRAGLAPQTRAARAYPWLVAGALVAIGGAAFALDLGPARGIREGFEWVSRADGFMDTVQESEPLVGPRAEAGVLPRTLGWAFFSLVLVWPYLLRRGLRVAGQRSLLLWAVPLAVLTLQSLGQRRFAEALAVPLSFAIGVGFEALRARFLARAPRTIVALVALALALASQAPAIGTVLGTRDPARNFAVGGERDHYLGQRRALEWLREQGASDEVSVLAHWDQGHAIEWVAGLGSVATNFGSYVGVDSYRDPARFFLAQDPAFGEALLERRRTRWVLVTPDLMLNLSSVVRIAELEGLPGLIELDARGRWVPGERFGSTLAGRLLAEGAPLGAVLRPTGSALGFLRLVYVSPHLRAEVGGPAALIWERVAGARIEAQGEIGESLELELPIEFASSPARIVFRAREPVDAQGRARARIPYATDVDQGDARVRTRVRWRIGARSGELDVDEGSVQQGAVLRVD